MSFVQQFWQKNLQEVYKDVKESRDAKEATLKSDCFSKNSKNQEGFNTCLRNFYDEFSKFQLRVEYEQRRVFECLQELKKGGGANQEVQKMCLRGVLDQLKSHANQYKENIQKN
ncbi:hypothetical protein ABPG74_022016 [Tetrahymena malaccensis]